MALSNEQLTQKVTEIIDSVNDLITVAGNLTPKMTTDQLSIINENDHVTLEQSIGAVEDSLTLLKSKINAVVTRVNEIGTRVGIGPNIELLS